MSKAIWSKFFWQNWTSDAGLRRCSLAARGLWMEMLCVAAQHVPIGYVAINGEGLSEEEIGRMAGVDPTSVATLICELERNGVFSRNRDGLIYSRKMVRDSKKAAASTKNLPPSNIKENQAQGGNALAYSSNLESLFEEMWTAYPKREGPNPKHMAKKAFVRAVEAGADPAAVIAGAKTFAARESKNIGTPYIAQAATWLNQRRWEDYQPRGDEKESMERTWLFLLEREQSTGSWMSRNVSKSDIPQEFIERWLATKKEAAE